MAALCKSCPMGLSGIQRSPILRQSLSPLRVHVASRRQHATIARVAKPNLDNGSSGNDGPGNNGGSGGNGGNGGNNEGQGGSSEEQPQKKGGFLGALLAGWSERVKYDAEFPIKVAMEQIIGVGASVVGDMSSRPNWGLNELDFVFSTLVVGSIMNFSIMYLLAPTAGAAGAGASSGFLARALSEEFLKKWGAPGGNMFEPGKYTAGQRMINFGYKGITFAAIGLVAGIVGTATTNGLLALRQQLDPSYTSTNEPPNILFNAMTWSAHMGLSSNLRYQILGGTDRILVNMMPIGAFRAYQAVIRAVNNVVGGISFVTLARLFGVQKAAAVVVEEVAPPPPPVVEEKKGKKNK